MMVMVRAQGTFRTLVPSAQFSGPATERWVKYIANRPAKNISSLASQTTVPMTTTLGRFTLTCVELEAEVADDTLSLWLLRRVRGDAGVRVLRLCAWWWAKSVLCGADQEQCHDVCGPARHVDSGRRSALEPRTESVGRTH